MRGFPLKNPVSNTLKKWDGTIRHLVYTYNYSELRDIDLTLGNGLGYMNGSVMTNKNLAYSDCNIKMIIYSEKVF